MKFSFYNDTGREVKIHPATISHGCKCDMSPILAFEERVFELPKGTYLWMKMWDYGGLSGLKILVSPREDMKDELADREIIPVKTEVASLPVTYRGKLPTNQEREC